MFFKTTLIAIILLFISLNASAVVEYEVSLLGNSDLNIVNFFDVESNEAVNYWSITFIVPENSEIVSISDSIGKINDFNRNGSQIEFQSNIGTGRRKETFRLDLIERNAVKEKFPELKLIELSLAGFPKTPSKVNANIPNILSFSSSFGFTENITKEKAVFEGIGPPAIRLYFSDKKTPYKNFVVFGNDSFDLSKEDELFYVIERVTGRKKPFPFYPIVVLSDADYNKETLSFSQGVYLNGLIFLRESTFNEELQPNQINTTLLHEATHGFNEQVLKWSDENSLLWFNEGVARYLELVVDVNKERIYPNLFGEDKSFTEGNQITTFKSGASEEELWNYYKNNEKFMETWNYNEDKNLSFGYAFSELVIRNYVKKHGFDSLQEIFYKLSMQKEKIESVKDSTQLVLNLMQTDLRPCYNSNKELFSHCLKEANYLHPLIPSSIRFIEEKSVDENKGVKIDVNKELPKDENKEIKIDLNKQKPLDVNADLNKKIIKPKDENKLLGQNNNSKTDSNKLAVDENTEKEVKPKEESKKKGFLQVLIEAILEFLKKLLE